MKQEIIKMLKKVNAEHKVLWERTPTETIYSLCCIVAQMNNGKFKQEFTKLCDNYCVAQGFNEGYFTDKVAKIEKEVVDMINKLFKDKPQ